jgi:hypothetical protein
MSEKGGPEAERLRRQRRRSIGLALLLAAVVVVFYFMTFAHGPTIINRPL